MSQQILEQKNSEPRSGARTFDEQDVERFRMAADAFVAKHTVSREAARSCLMAMGIIDESGNLTPQYR